MDDHYFIKEDDWIIELCHCCYSRRRGRYGFRSNGYTGLDANENEMGKAICHVQMQEFALISMLMYSYLHLFYTHVMIGQEYKREDEVPNEGDVIVWTPEPQSAHLSAVLLPVECPNHEVLCQSGEEFYVSQVRNHHQVLSQSGEKELQYVVHRPLGQLLWNVLPVIR